MQSHCENGPGRLIKFGMLLFHFQITQDQVADFSKDISKFKESFRNEGPSSIGTDLDAGNFRRLLLLE